MARTADKTDIPRRLIAAGRELFTRQGFNATGVQQIADTAGVPKGSFYNHFASKEAFAAAIVDDYAEAFEVSWGEMLASAPATPLAAIRHVCTQMIEFHACAEIRCGCLVGNFAAEVAEASPVCRERMAQAMRGWQASLGELIGAAQAVGEIRNDISAAALAAFFWDTWEGALLRMKLADSMAPLEEAVALMLDRFFLPHP